MDLDSYKLSCYKHRDGLAAEAAELAALQMPVSVVDCFGIDCLLEFGFDYFRGGS